MGDIILTTTEAAMHAGVSYSTIMYWIKRGYLGDTNKQCVTSGRSCGYKIKQSDLDRHIHGWTIEENPKPEPKKEDTFEVLRKVEPIQAIDKTSLRIAAANLRIAIDFAQEELTKIEKLL